MELKRKIKKPREDKQLFCEETSPKFSIKCLRKKGEHTHTQKRPIFLVLKEQKLNPSSKFRQEIYAF